MGLLTGQVFDPLADVDVPQRPQLRWFHYTQLCKAWLVIVMMTLIVAPSKTHHSKYLGTMASRKPWSCCSCFAWRAEGDCKHFSPVLWAQLSGCVCQPRILNTHPVIFQANRVNTWNLPAPSYHSAAEWSRTSPGAVNPPSENPQTTSVSPSHALVNECRDPVWVGRQPLDWRKTNWSQQQRSHPV